MQLLITFNTVTSFHQLRAAVLAASIAALATCSSLLLKLGYDGHGVLSYGIGAHFEKTSLSTSLAPSTLVLKGGISRRVRISTTAMAKSPSSSVPFSDTIVVEAKGEHKATVVFLHGLASTGEGWLENLTSLNAFHPSFRWIIPTASFRKVELTGQFCNAWYNARDIFKEDHIVDLEGLDESAERIVGMLSSESAKVGGEKVKLVVAGFSQGCATSLYITRCLIVGKYSNGKPFPDLKLDAVIALGGWMPTIKTFEDEVKRVPDARQKAQEIPMFFGHCEDDNIMPVRQAPSAARCFGNVGVKDITLKLYPEGGHAVIPEEMDDLCAWMASKLGLDQPE